MALINTIEAVQPHLYHAAHTLLARNETSSAEAAKPSRPPIYKFIGVALAVASGVFIGISFVLKKAGLLKANVKYNEEAGEGYGYLKNAWWWGGMILMIIGEVCNFVAYAFTDAILVTPLGALSVVITTILSAIFLKERLSFVGKVGCFACIVGSVVIAVNAPEQSAVSDIQDMQHFVIAPGFLSYAGVIIVGCAFIAFWVAPRYGKKSMFVYLSICSLIGGLSVVATQGLGAAVIAQIDRGNQFNQWFLYVLLVFVVGTLLTEIIYLNKALNIFNAALVTPTYYVFFTSTTIITSAILFRGFHGTAVQIITVIMGFLQICTGVVLLQLSKSAKDVPDAAVFKGDLNQVREVAEQEAAESEPKADAIRGAASIIRRLSTPRQKMEQAEAKRLREEKLADHLEPLKENEIVEWDGLRRRKTIIGQGPVSSPLARRKTVHPPLGMTHFPSEQHQHFDDDGQPRDSHGFFGTVRDRAQTILHPRQPRHADTDPTGLKSPVDPVALTDIHLHPNKSAASIEPYGPGSYEEARSHIFGRPMSKKGFMPSPRSKPLPAEPVPSPGLSLNVPGQDGAKRQFSFSNFINRASRQSDASHESHHRPNTAASNAQKKAMKTATEEERLGLVKGDSYRASLENTSPERNRDPSTSLLHSRTRSNSDPDTDPVSLYGSRDNQYPYTRTHSDRRYHRSDSPGALSDTDESDDALQQRPRIPTEATHHQPFSFSSHDRSQSTSQFPPFTPQQERPSSRRRPSPPAVYTPPPPQLSQTSTKDFVAAAPSRGHEARPSQSQQQLPATQQGRRITLSNDRGSPERPPPRQHLPAFETPPRQPSQAPTVLQPPVQFLPSQQQAFHRRQDSSPEDRGRSLTNVATSDLPSPTRRDPDSANSSKERFKDVSAKEREERRQRAQKRGSRGGWEQI